MADWTDEMRAKLRMLWDEGHSTAECGRRMGISKNAVVGGAHRMDLPSRPSPINRLYPPRQSKPRIRRVTGATLPSLAALAAPIVVQAPPRRSRDGCCWPIGTPGKGLTFCGSADVPLGRVYCDLHAKVAYVRVRDRRDDDATAFRFPTR